jgi:C1A family cysteine protease
LRKRLDDLVLRKADLTVKDVVPAPPDILPAPVGILPGSISLVDACAQPVRDQGDRPTCTVFAAVAILEYLLCRNQKARIDLSEQYLYWLVSQAGELVEGRAPLEAVFDLARTAGVCQESLWPYDPTFLADNLTHGDPPGRQDCDADATGHRFTSVRSVSDPQDVSALCQLLDDGQPVAFEIPLFDSYWIPSLYYAGQLALPPQGAGIIDRHDVVLVGYQIQPQDASQNVFVFRNSVGPLWGRDSAIGPGYGTTPFDYIASFAEKGWIGSV